MPLVQSGLIKTVMSKEPFPGVISSVVAQPKTRRHLGTRVNVFIDEKFSFALAVELAIDFGLKPGFVITPQLLDELLRRDGDARAYARALNFLSYRARSSKEVRDKLLKDEFPETVVVRVLENLHLNGELNDAKFSDLWVESRSRSRPKGAQMLKQELRQKGVDRETIDASLPDSDEELANCIEALRPNLRKWNGLETRERQNKAFAWAQRRGFGFSVARNALRVLDEEDESNEP